MADKEQQQSGADETPEKQVPPADHPEAEAAAGAAAPVAAAPWYARAPLGLVLFLILALLAAGGWLVYQKYAAEEQAKALKEQELARLREQNDAKEAYLDELRALLQKDPCEIAPSLGDIRPPAGSALPVLPGSGMEGRNADSPAQDEEAAPVAPFTPDSGGPADDDRQAPEAQAQAADAGGNQYPPLQAKEPANIVELLEQGTVLLLAQEADGIRMGSGFFVAQDTIVTNAHVVGTAREVVYINKFVGSLRSARVILRTQSRGIDLAVLKTRETIPVKPLKLQENLVKRMDKVSAWGFPATLSEIDPKFRGLLAGNLADAPAVISSEGSVSVVLENKPPLIVHSATVSQGNSGGPLVNEAGEVVGINTMIKLDDQSYRQASMAIPSTVITQYLTANKIPFTPVGTQDANKGPAKDQARGQSKAQPGGDAI